MYRQAKPSLADVIVGTTAMAAMALLGDEASSSFSKARAYVQRFSEIDACAQAAGEVENFTKVCGRLVHEAVNLRKACWPGTCVPS